MRIRRVKGRIIKITGGDYNMYAGGSIITTSNGPITETAGEGITYGEPDPMPLWDYGSKAVVHFRPCKGWQGEYGFDWMRCGDTVENKSDSVTADIPYEYYLIDTVNRSERISEFDALKKVYGGHTDRFKYVNGKGLEAEYYPSWLMLFPSEVDGAASGYANTEANLSLIVEVQESPDSYFWKYDKTLFELSMDELPTAKGLHKNIALRIKCLKPFSRNQEIIVYTINKDNPNNQIQVGSLKLLANDTIYKPKIALVKVETNLGIDINIGEPQQDDEAFIKRIFRQALMEPQIEWEELNTTISPADKFFYDATDPIYKGLRSEHFLRKHRRFIGKEARIVHDTNLIHYELLDCLYHDGKGEKYKDYFRAYYIAEATMIDSAFNSLAGISSEEENMKSCIIFKGGLNSEDTSSHEILHTMGLHHSFEKKNQFAFNEKATDNIMDYNKKEFGVPLKESKGYIPKIQLWKWQIDILRNNFQNNSFKLGDYEN